MEGGLQKTGYKLGYNSTYIIGFIPGVTHVFLAIYTGFFASFATSKGPPCVVILLRLYRDYNKPFQGAGHEPIRKNGMSGFRTVTTKIYDIFRFRNLNLNLLLILFATGILDWYNHP